MTYSILAEFLTSTGLQSLIGAVQVIAVIFVLRGMAKLETQGASLRALVDQQAALHDVDDPKHHGAKLWWGVGVNTIEEQLTVVTERQRTISERQRDFTESIRELKQGQSQLTTSMVQLTNVATKAINQREHLVG
jgi:hypothetical protein